MRSRSRRGFTLLEIIASIALFSIMVVGIASTLGETNRISSRLQIRQKTVASGQIALDRLRRDLQMAFNENVQRSPSFFVVREVGAGQEMTFSYLDSPIKTLFSNRTPGILFASYSLETAGDGTYNLIRSETPLWNAERIDESPSQVLARGILGWRLEMYDFRNDEWIPSWDSAGAQTGGYYPLAVRIRLEVTDPSLPPEQRASRGLVYQTAVMLLNEYMVRR